jgi:hypothetical protein
VTDEQIQKLLSELPVPRAEQARERTVGAARAQAAAGELPRRPRAGRRRLLTAAAAGLVLVAALLTPPGRTASGWVGELVGVGEVGGPPTHDARGFGGPRDNAIVINNGTSPDGSRYEWVAYGCKVDLRDEGLPTRFEGFGLSFEWPGVEGRESGGSCEEAQSPEEERRGAFDSHGVHIVPSQFEGVAEPDLVVSGATGSRVHRVRVFYNEPSGERHELKVDFERMERKLRDRLTASADLGGTFVAFVPGEWAARDEVPARLDLRALMGTGKLELGPIARAERRAARAAIETCRPHEPDFAALSARDDVEAVQRAMKPYRDCLDEHKPPSPIETIAYDERGRELERFKEPIMFPAPRPPLAAPEAERGKRPVHGDADGEPVVLAAGRAPDGAEYEFFVERFDESDGRCVTHWWPRVPMGPANGHCGPGLPPRTAFGRRHPERIAAKAFGFLGDEAPATEHYMLSGFTRPNVARVEVVYKDRAGRPVDAPVELTQVAGALARRMGADGPFGYFVGFVPPAARRQAVEVVAYDEDGAELSSVAASRP